MRVEELLREGAGEPGYNYAFLDELTDEERGEPYYACSDTDFCNRRLEERR